MPLAPDVELKTPEKKEWPLIPEDVYQVEITDLTAEEAEWKGVKKDVFKFEFTIIEPGQYYGRKLWKKGSRVSPCPSNNNKAPLTWKVASAVAKHPLTEPEGKAYTIADMNAMIGKQIRIGVSVTAPNQDGKQFNNADSFFMVKQDLPPFDESKVKKDDLPAAAAKPTPAEIVEKASAGKFKPAAPGDSEMEIGDVEVEDIPY
jgi:hypothetical protein